MKFVKKKRPSSDVDFKDRVSLSGVALVDLIAAYNHVVTARPVVQDCECHTMLEDLPSVGGHTEQPPVLSSHACVIR